MNPNPHNNQKIDQGDEALRQLLLELHYDLLDDDQAAALRQRIASDPSVASLWAETLVVAGQFAEAARVQRDAKSDDGEGAPDTHPVARDDADPRPSPDPNSDRFLRRWIISLAAAASLAVALCSIRYFQALPPKPNADLFVEIEPVAGPDAESRNEFLVVVRSAEPASGGFERRGPIVPATISFQVISKGATLFFGQAETSRTDACRIAIPDDVTIPGDAVLRVDADPQGDEKTVRMSVPLEPTRCLTFLSTDRPVYRPGETIFYRSVTLNRRTLAAHLDVPIRYELVDPSGAIVDDAVIEGVTERGVGNGAFVIPRSAAGGTYQLIARSLDGFFPDQVSDLEIRQYRAVRLKTDLEFLQRSYGVGATVEARLQVRRADDSIPVAAAARIQAVVDGEMVYQSSGTIDLDGSLSLAFDLPGVIRDGEGTLAIAIDDGSVTETAVRTIPIHLGRADVAFYPEGGYLVSGIDNRVYFSARDLDGNPIEIRGEILSQAGRMVASVQTRRDGMGRFEFKPESGQRYSLRITSPLDITETPWLPSVVEAIPVIDTGRGVFEPDEPITMTLRSTKRRKCLVRAVCRGELVGVKVVELPLGDTPVSVPVPPRARGVVRVTILDAEQDPAVPLVERLVYRRDRRSLHVDARVDDGKTVHSPGESVRMTIAVTDENDRPVPGAVLGVAAVDDAALSLGRRELPTIATHFLLTSEVESPEDLEHANFYLAEGPEAEEALDLLLGTQGWRRFVSGSSDGLDETFHESLTRLLKLDGERSGLIRPKQTNETTIAAALYDYQRKARTIWSGFVAEIRAVLIVIGLFWLVGLLVRPRPSSSAVAGGILLLVSAALTFGGCGSGENRIIDAPSRTTADASVEDRKFANEMSESGSFGAANESAVDSAAPDDSAGVSADEETPFVERVVRAFLGEGGSAARVDPIARQISPEQLRQWAQSRDLDAQELADRLLEELRFPIRQYAHVHRPSDDTVRTDFAETLYWNPTMVTDSTGTVSIRFDLSDSQTMFRVHVDAHTSDGRLGSGGGQVRTQIPIQVEPKLPLEVSGGDRIELPVGLVNSTDQDGTIELRLQTDSLLSVGQQSQQAAIEAGERLTRSFTIDVHPTARPAESTIRVGGRFDAGDLADEVERPLRVMPLGYPFQISHSDSLSGELEVDAVLPTSILSGSLTGSVTVYPSTQSQISAGLESILREPHGCFEQASASNYPNVMAIQLLQLDGAVDESARRRTESLLRRGYRKLAGYECSTLGYEWFGNDPGHEALSAFGLMQFSEMAKFIEVDPEMLKRTRRWLLERRDGNGGFQRNTRHLHQWSVRQDVVNAYLLWALSEADRAAATPQRTENELARELDAMQSVAQASGDPYLIALSAITLGNVGRASTANGLRDKLASAQLPDGRVEGQTTITQSGGFSRTVETTSLAVLAWAQSESHLDQARAAATWLVENRRAGGFGSTQATVLALKALIAMHEQLSRGDGGQVDVIVNGEVVQTIRWSGMPDEGQTWQMTPEFLDLLSGSAATDWKLRCEQGSEWPVLVHLQGRTDTPRSDPECPISIDLAFAGDETEAGATRGDTLEINAEVTNRTESGRPMTVAVIGLPGGLEAVVEGLEDLRDSGKIDYYELRGRELVLYWRTFAPQETRRVAIPCIAEIGGRYTGPASRAYLYYTAESKSWHRPLIVTIE